MEQLILVANPLRQKYRFGGHIHLKTIPGAASELIDEAGKWPILIPNKSAYWDQKQLHYFD